MAHFLPCIFLSGSVRWQKNWEKERPVCIANLQTRTSHVGYDKNFCWLSHNAYLLCTYHVFSLKYLTHIGLYAGIDLWSDNNFMYYWAENSTCFSDVLAYLAEWWVSMVFSDVNCCTDRTNTDLGILLDGGTVTCY